QDELWFLLAAGEFLDPLYSFLSGDDGARVAIAQNVNESFVPKLDIERDSDHARANDSQRSHDPFWAVFGEENHGIAAFKIVPDEPIPQRACASRQFLNRPTMSILLAEDQQRRLVAMLASRVHDRL